MTQLSKNFSLEELVFSSTAKAKNIDNLPNQVQIENLQALVDNTLQPLREKLGKSIKITSGFRSDKLNDAVGGIKTSQHSFGQAADIQVEGMTPLQLCKFIIREEIEFDQLICEPTWVHVSYDKKKLRKQVLTATKTPAGMKYSAGLTA